MTAVAELILENEVDRVAILNLLSIDVFKGATKEEEGDGVLTLAPSAYL